MRTVVLMQILMLVYREKLKMKLLLVLQRRNKQQIMIIKEKFRIKDGLVQVKMVCQQLQNEVLVRLNKHSELRILLPQFKQL
jgi:hypothetical protein